MSEKNRMFRKMLNEPGMIIAPGVHDAIGARALQMAGFKVGYLTGNGMTASRIGVPDIGLATQTEMATWANNISSCVEVPIICDSDNGYGDVTNTWRTVRAFEDAGISAIHIEDQGFPKKCGCYAGVNLVSEEDAVKRIKVALKARRDPDFVIIARTDARRAMGSLDEAIRRGRLFEKAGADVLFFEQLENKDEIKEIIKAFPNTPVMYDILEERRDLIYTTDEVAALGVKICIFALSSVLSTALSMMELMNIIKNTHTTLSLFDGNKLMELHKYEELMGINQMTDLQNEH
ncbi:MAG: isocitrate lyase/PEP mutase family protein [Lachnospiraceae bacterium]|nr:isocitrate lyase/PEP mutase family protein [Lachnospiraceae bacterium]